ncbi:MAG: helix-turn-helix transcriptional regulator [Deltaproteobacteria bacterium]|nr:helix-turn-helix transcriptional regulator [Deltaproteobacteria bacterium]
MKTHIGERIAALRSERGFSKAKLARDSIIHPSDISKFENGHARPYPGQVERLARALGVQPADLLDPEGGAQ